MTSHTELSPLRSWVRHRFWSDRKVWLTAAGVAGCVLLLRATGFLQSWELSWLDQISCWRPAQARDSRIVIVGIDEHDLSQMKKWPISDAAMANLLKTVIAAHPKAIGLDIYRDFPVEPGHADLQQVFATTPNLVGIEKIEDLTSFAIAPPAELQERDQVGFNNVVVDTDGKVRRALLYWTVEGKAHASFALKLALKYLEEKNISPRSADINPNYLQVGSAVFPSLQPNSGGYIGVNTGGYQILANFRNPPSAFQIVSVSDVMQNRVPPEFFRDRIVLIGSTAVSLKDFFYTSNSATLANQNQLISGVELQANFISQILDAALGKRSLIRVWPEGVEWIWIIGWSWVGASLSWKLRSPRKSILMMMLAVASLSGVCYLAFLQGWWIPLVPPLLTLAGSSLVMVGYLVHQQDELKKSKEFLQSVINSIPDPVFVKDQHHRWIVLNSAFCRLVGYPLASLLDKSDPDVFPSFQADIVWDHDQLTFTAGSDHESEEELTSADGITYLIATKRSLHRDAAGNVFLVGVIRDITHRKRLEDELRRTTAELVRSNAELRQTENHLRQMAYHDPLTGLPNRKQFQECLSQLIESAQHQNRLVALLFLDLDGFKQINDSYGHHMGDLLLKAVAHRLKGCLRGSDMVARLGGDEFVVLLPTIPTLQDVTRVAEKICTTLSQHFVLEGELIPVTTSIGISLYPLDGQDMEGLLAQADRAMYNAKERGKNQYAFSHPTVAYPGDRYGISATARE